MASADSEKDAKALVKLVNELLQKARIDVRVRTCDDLNADLFVKFLEQLCDETLFDVIREPKTKSDEIHNIEIVLNTLSESLSTPLSHISPDDVVAGNVKALRNLIEIFSGLVQDETSEVDRAGLLALVKLANSLLEKAEMNFRITDFGEINSMFFVRLLDGLCRETIPGIVVSPETTDEEERNVEMVLRILEEVLGFSLSHIVPKDIVNGNVTAVQNMLNIFSGFIEGILASEAGVSENDKELISLATRILTQLKSSTRVRTTQDLNSSLFIHILELLCNEPLSDVIRESKNAEDEMHNVKVVLKTLQDALSVQLSHIKPRDVVGRDYKALKNLLNILLGVIEGKPISEEVPSEDEELLVNLANELWAKSGGSNAIRLRSIRDLNSSFFVRLLERVCEGSPANVVQSPRSVEDEVHNLSVVIETLSDMANVSLSHLSPRKIVSGDREHVKNLLLIFQELLKGERSSKHDKHDNELVELANRLMRAAGFDVTVKTSKELNAWFFLSLLEKLSPDLVQGSLRDSLRLADDDVSRLNFVLDTLSDVLKMSLSHIRPRAVIEGDAVAVKHLLQLFFSLVEASRKQTSEISEDILVKLMNSLLAKVNISSKVKSVEEMKALVFVSVVEQLCSGALPGVIRHPMQTEDDVRNIQIVISTLENLLKISLSHIPASAIIHRNRLAVRNLIDILSQLADGQETRLRLRQLSSVAALNLANELLTLIPCDIRNVKSLEEVNASFFVTLLRSLCKDEIPDLLPKPKSQEEEIHNLRVVVNTVSDRLQLSLSHISPRKVAFGERLAVGHLLEVFYELSKQGLNSSNSLNRGDSAIVELANEMLSKLHINIRVRSLRELTPSVFVSLFEGLCAETLADAIPHPVSKDDEIHNIDTVIDALSTDILSTSLSHISGRDVVNGDQRSIANLLEVFHGLMEFILEEIKDDSRNGQLAPGVSWENGDPDWLTPEVVDHVIQSRLDKQSNSSPQTEILSNDRSYKVHTTHAPELLRSRNSDQLESLRDQQESRTTQLQTQQLNGRNKSLDHVIAPHSSLNRASHNSESEVPRIPDHQYTREISSGYSRDKISTNDITSGSRHTTNFSLRNNETLQNWHDMEIPHEAEMSVPSVPELTSRTLIKKSATKTYVPSTRSVLATNDKSKTLPEWKSSFDRPDKQDVPSETYQDYLMKYYGRPSRSESNDEFYLSDGCIDYERSSEDSQPASFERELESCRRRLKKKTRAVRFDDYLDDCATGSLGALRRQFKNEDRSVLLRKELLDKVYHDELVDAVQEAVIDTRKSSKEKDREFRKKIFKPPQTEKYRTKKYSVPGSVLLPRSRPRSRVRQPGGAPNRQRCASASPSVGYRAPDSFEGNNVLRLLLDEFPYLHLAPETLNNMWRKAAQQVEHISRTEADTHKRKSKAQEQIEDAERRQKAVLDIMRKDLIHQQHLKEARNRRRDQLAVNAKIREQRQQTARIRKYYDEFHVKQRAKMLKRRTKEELMFKNLFSDGLDIQKDRIREIKKYAKEQREVRTKRQKEELESLENFYRDQFAMLAETLENERCNTTIRDKAQAKILEQTKIELRKKMEKEIRDFQQRLLQDEDNIYCRELDAERLRRELRLAQFHNKV